MQFLTSNERSVGVTCQRRCSEAGAAVQSIVVMAALILLTGAFLLYTFGRVVPPGTMGVRQIAFGPGQGFQRVGLQPGYHWSIPTYSTVHLVPRGIQILNLTREAQRSRGASLGPLEIQTADRTTVDVDISVLSRFYTAPGTVDGKDHGGPADLVQRIGRSEAQWSNHIRRTIEDQLKRTLGKLSTPEFYDPFKRQEQLDTAQSKANELLVAEGIKIEAILLRRYTYRDARIDNAIFQKNLQDQEERLNGMASNFAAAQATLEQVAAEWDAKIQTLSVEGENKERVLRSEGDLLENQKRAEGDLAVARAKAEVDRLRAGALAASAGARIHVAREMAPLLGSLRGGVVSGVDPYDLGEWAKRFGAGEK